MHAPFYKFGLFGDPAALIAAFLIGLGFGFFLERAGFASARKLAAQFYFRDLAVLKVMFTAIVTAMLGLFLLGAVGFLDLSQVTLKPTVLWADVLGGLLLGFGFVIGGYCPGTSVAACATGRIDGWVYVAGVFAGVWSFGELAGRWAGFASFVDEAGHARLTLAGWTGIPYGMIVLAVALMAVAAFAFAELAEVWIGGKPLADQPLVGLRSAALNPSRRVLGLLVLGGLLAALVGDPYRGPNLTVRQADLASTILRQSDQIDVSMLADSLIAGNNAYRLVDLRAAEAFAQGTLPGAESVPLADLPGRSFKPTEKVLLFADDGTTAAQAWVFLKARGMRTVYVLRGGMSAWNRDVLHPAAATPPTIEDQKRIAVARAMGGTPMYGGTGTAAVPLEDKAAGGRATPPAAPAPPAAAPAPPAAAPAPSAPPHRTKHEGC